jgi:hypothetical protein
MRERGPWKHCRWREALEKGDVVVFSDLALGFQQYCSFCNGEPGACPSSQATASFPLFLVRPSLVLSCSSSSPFIGKHKQQLLSVTSRGHPRRAPSWPVGTSIGHGSSFLLLHSTWKERMTRAARATPATGRAQGDAGRAQPRNLTSS